MDPVIVFAVVAAAVGVVAWGLVSHFDPLRRLPPGQGESAGAGRGRRLARLIGLLLAAAVAMLLLSYLYG